MAHLLTCPVIKIIYIAADFRNIFIWGPPLNTVEQGLKGTYVAVILNEYISVCDIWLKNIP